MRNNYSVTKQFFIIKRLLFVFAILFSGSIGYAQYVISYELNQGNPGNINTEADATVAGWKTLATGNVSNNFWSVNDTIPFTFNFYSQPFTMFRVSQNGLLTFSTNVTGVPANQNTILPSISLPNNTIAGFWDQFTTNPPTGSNDFIYSKTFGTAPNRQHWVKWFSFEYGDNNNTFAYFAIVLEETTNKVYVVDMNYVSGTYSTTVGIQQNSSNAQYVTGSPNLAFNIGGNAYTDNDYYEFGPPAPMVFVSADCIHPDTNFVRPAQANAQMLRVNVKTAGNLNPMNVTQFVVSTAGTTSLLDINAIKCYYTGSDSVFNSSSQFGVSVTNIANTVNVAGSQTLGFGNNYFWITYDVSPAAPTGNVLDAACLQFTLSGNAQVPTNSNPPGARSVSNDILIGTGNVTNSPTTYPSPYGNWYWGARQQYLIRATELSAQGMVAGKITSVSFNVALAQGTALSNFSVKMGHTSLIAMTSWESNMLTVYSAPTYTEAAGWNLHTFDTPFIWDGVSNIVVEVCFNNTAYTQNAIVYQSNTPFTSTRLYNADAANVCSSTLLSATFTMRPNMSFGRPVPFHYDAQVAQVSEPVDITVANTALPVKVKLRNLGVLPLQKAVVGWTLNGQAQTGLTWTGSVPFSNLSSDITLGNVNLAPGGHVIRAWTSLPNDTIDQDPLNDTISKYIMACPGALTGVYTVGNSGAYFKNLDDAFNALHMCGLNAPVVLRIMPGTYIGRYIFDSIPGLSGTNTLTIESFNGDSTSVVIQNNASNADENYVFWFTKAKFVKVKGITMKALASGFSRVVVVGEQSGNITIENCELTGTAPAAMNTSHSLIFAQSTSVYPIQNIIVRNSLFQSGAYGMYLGGGTVTYSAGTLVENNIFQNQRFRAIYMNYQESPEIRLNTILTTSNATSYRGIFLYMCQNAISISRNKVSVSNEGFGISLLDCQGSSSSTGLIVNNFVHLNSTQNTGSSGININNSSYHNIHFNSVNITGNQTGSSAMYLATGSTNLNLRNNIFSNKAAGYAIYSQVLSSAFVSNFNDFYSNGSNIAWRGANLNTIIAWRNATSQDFNSVSIDPIFYSSNDLHVSNPALDNLGTPITGITIDIDGQTRNTATPDMGADEFTIYTLDIGVIELVSPTSGSCLSTAEQVVIRIKNFGVNDINFAVNPATINVSVSGMVSQTFPAYSLNVGYFASNATADITISNAFNMTLPGTYTFNASTSMTGDQNGANNVMAPASVSNHVITSLPYEEDFEGFGPGAPGVMGPGWTRDNIGNFQWHVAAGTTPSANTGPVVDHTLGTAAGRYMFTEATGGANGNQATLLSPCFELAGVYKPVLRFYYHMHGSTMGSLYLDVLSNGVWTSNVWSKVGQQHTTQAAAWSEAIVDLSAFSGRVQLRFRAIRGSDFYGDMAIDDILVASHPFVNLGPDTTFCAGASLTLDAGFAAGNIYEWRKDYQAAIIGVNPVITVNTTGVYTVKVTNIYGFSTIDTVVIGVTPLPVVSFTGLQTNYCLNSAAQTLTGSPAGGSFTGGGMSGIIFNPQSAGLGSHNILYSYTNVQGCSNTSAMTTNVHPLPTVLFTGLPQTSCSNGSTVTLTGMPAGGVFAGPGMTANVFNPATAGAGTHTITYTSPPSSHGCTNTHTQNITVFAPVTAAFTGLGTTYCLNASPVTLTGSPSGGTFTGAGIAGSIFYPQNAGTGTHNITYQFQDANGCFSSVSKPVTINSLPLVSAGNDQTIGYNTFTTLTGFAGGGVGPFSYAWSPASQVQNATVQNPQTVNLSVTTVFTLAVTNQSTNCQNSDAVNITVIGGPLSAVVQSTADSICSGTSVQLSALASGGNGNFTYQWSASGGGFSSTLQNPVVTPTVTTTYSVTVTDGPNTTSAQKVVTVIPTPQPTIAGLQGPYCQNSPPIFAMLQPAGGSFSGNGVSGNSFSPAVAGPGLHQVSYHVVNSFGCQATASKTIIVYPQPAVNAGNDTMVACGSAPVMIGSSPVSGYSYQWTPTTGLSSAVVANPMLSPSLSSWYYLSVVDLNTGCSGSDSVLITVSGAPIAVVSQDTMICDGGTAMLTASGGTSYAWSHGATTAITIVTPQQTSVYTVTVTDAGCSSTASVTVTVRSISIDLGPDTTFIDVQPLMTLDAGPGYASYFWSTGDTTQVITVNTAGFAMNQWHQVSCYVTDSFGCQAADTMMFKLVWSSIEEIGLANAMHLYPNPNQGTFYLQNLSENNTIIEISVLSITGDAVYRFIPGKGDNMIQINPGRLSAGVYMLRIETDNGLVYKRFVVQR